LNTDQQILVAPRELTDLVYRCARTAGVSAGVAATLSALWTEAAIAVAGTNMSSVARHGLPVDRAAFDSLSRSAEAFLVSERLLDQIAES